MGYQEFVVAIGCKKEDGYYVLGTGISISKDLVLTAKHVVDQAVDKPLCVYWGACHGAPLPQPDNLGESEVVWRAADVDAALLHYPRPDGSSLQSLPLRAWPSEGAFDWESIGFPDVGEAISPIGFRGTVQPTSGRSLSMELSVDCCPEKMSQWRGMSGAPVIVAGNLVAIVKEVPHDFSNKRLHAVPLRILLKDAGFRDAVRSAREEEFQKFRAKMRCELAKVFCGAGNDICSLMASEYGFSGIGSAEEYLASRVVDSLPQEFLGKLYDAARELYGAAGGWPVIVSKIFSLALPILDDPEIQKAARAVDGGMGMAVIELDVGTRTLAEIAMARADGAPVALVRAREGESDTPGKYMLPTLPEGGRDQASGQSIRDFIDELDGLLLEKPDDFCKDLWSNIYSTFVHGGQRGQFDRLAENRQLLYVNGKIDAYMRRERRRLYYVAVMSDDNDVCDRASEVLKKLSLAFESIVFIEINRDPEKIFGSLAYDDLSAMLPLLS